MKKCRTLNGLLKDIEKDAPSCLPYTSKAKTRDGHIIYLATGTNLIVTDETYEKIESRLSLV